MRFPSIPRVPHRRLATFEPPPRAVRPARIGLLCADHDVAPGDASGGGAQLRALAAALLRRGHAVHALVARGGDDAALAALVGAGLTVTLLGEAPDAAIAGWIEAHALEQVLERLAGPAPRAARAAAARGVAHVTLVPARPATAADAAPTASRAAVLEWSATRAALTRPGPLAACLRARVPAKVPVVVEPGVVDASFFAPPAPADLAEVGARLGPRDAIRVAVVAHHCGSRDLVVVLRAIARARTWQPLRVVFVGGGFERSGARELARLFGVRADFTGPVPHAQVPAWLASVDALLAPGSEAPSLAAPIPLLEAMAVGLPVIAAATAPVRAVVVDDETGVLVPPGDVAALAFALERTAGNRLMRERLAANARAMAVETLAAHHLVARLERLAADAGLPARA